MSNSSISLCDSPPVTSFSCENDTNCDTIAVSTIAEPGRKDITVNVENKRPEIEKVELQEGHATMETFEERDTELLDQLGMRFREKDYNLQERQQMINLLDAELKQAREREQTAGTERDSFYVRLCEKDAELQERQEIINNLVIELQRAGEREQIVSTERDSLNMRLREKDAKLQERQEKINHLDTILQQTKKREQTAIRDNIMFQDKILTPLEDISNCVVQLKKDQRKRQRADTHRSNTAGNSSRKRPCQEQARSKDIPPIREIDSQMQGTLLTAAGLESSSSPFGHHSLLRVLGTMDNNPAEESGYPSSTNYDLPLDLLNNGCAQYSFPGGSPSCYM